jgi:hypothetical protein
MKKRMRKSRSVKIGLLSGIAISCVALGGCTRSQKPEGSWDRVCVDKSNIVSDSRKCEEDQKFQTGAGYVPMHHWYYMHSMSGMYGNYPLGSRVSGGTFTAPANSSFSGGAGSHSSPVTRGGFGATGAGHSTSS